MSYKGLIKKQYSNDLERLDQQAITSRVSSTSIGLLALFHWLGDAWQ